MNESPPKLPAISRPLLAWYDRVRRELPFRRTRDPYAIWVSEIMLQQTQVTTVLPYFEHWMQTFPDVESLAKASEDAVLHAWQGLGYYSRARSLRRAAQLVVRDFGARIPSTASELTALPGVGPYTAGAVASIAFGERTPVVDGNVVRVLCRIFALHGDPARAPLKQQLWELAAALVPGSRPGDFNQALMELGATVCTPRTPACPACPVRASCRAQRDGLQLQLPELARRAPITSIRMAAAIVRRRDRLLVVKLGPRSPRWALMWQFPTVELHAAETVSAAAERAARETAGLVVRAAGAVATVKHSVTRYRITLEAQDCTRISGRAQPAGNIEQLAWCAPEELNGLALPAAHRKLCRSLLT